MYFAFYTEVALVIFLCYTMAFNYGFGTRDLIFQHFGVASVPFSILIIIWAEFRKFMVHASRDKYLDFLQETQDTRKTQLVG